MSGDIVWPLTTDAEYRQALAEVQRLTNAKPRPTSRDGRRLLGLAVAIERWELDHDAGRPRLNE